MKQKVIVFFDGVCGLCNQTVDFLFRNDPGHRLYFAPLQGQSFKDLVLKDYPQISKLNSIIVRVEKENQPPILYTQSQAVIFALSQTPKYHWLGLTLDWVPSWILNIGYRIVARFRYAIFGKYEACRVPTKAEEAWFLP